MPPDGKWEFYVIYAYLWSIFASNPNNPKEEGRDLPKRRNVPEKGTIEDAANKSLPNTYFCGSKEGWLKKGPNASSYKKIILEDSTKVNSKIKYSSWIST
jgi:hypothetical protein